MEDTKNLTPEEILQRERNAKRRRVKYKSVHTGRSKSYTEILREVIGNQMELYHEYVENSASQVDESRVVPDHINNGVEPQVQNYSEVPYTHEDVEKNDKTLSDRVSSIESYHEHYSEKDDYSDRRAKDRSHKEHSRRREDDRNRYRSRRRSRDREAHRPRKRSHHRNGYDRHHDSHRRSDKDRRY